MSNVTPMVARRRYQKPRTLDVITLATLAAYEFAEREDLIFPWLRQGESAMVWAKTGVGKTLLTLTLALMVAGGGEALGWHSPKPRKVLVVDGEMAAEDLQERAATLMGTIDGIDRDAAAANLHFMVRTWQHTDVSFPDIADRDGKNGSRPGQDVVFQEARKIGAELVILDNFSTLAEVPDENEAAAMTPVLTFLLRLKQARIGTILVHHAGKAAVTYRGSSKLAATFEVILGLIPLEETVSVGGAAFKLQWDKYRRRPTDATVSREVRLVDGDNGQQRWVVAETMDDAMRTLKEALETCRYSTQRELAAALQWDPAKVTRMKVKAAQAGIIEDAHWKRCLESTKVAAAEMMEEAESDF